MPVGINDGGQVVGFYESSTGGGGFLYDSGVYTKISDPLGTYGTSPTNINDAGQIIGYYNDSSDATNGFLYSGGVYTTIDAPGATDTEPYGINDVGEIVGRYVDGSGAQGFLFSGGVYTTLASPVTGINNAGQMVGMATLYSGSGILTNLMLNYPLPSKWPDYWRRPALSAEAPSPSHERQACPAVNALGKRAA